MFFLTVQQIDLKFGVNLFDIDPFDIRYFIQDDHVQERHLTSDPNLLSDCAGSLCCHSRIMYNDDVTTSNTDAMAAFLKIDFRLLLLMPPLLAYTKTRV